ncbi:MAG: cell wall-binding repeat-containing protein [Tissierella sp.]|uniref:cell wall-binding repeat-containing protein n=1 Tax=Tissierella sp. TaxID=41274 RepID=UPI003F95368C
MRKYSKVFAILLAVALVLPGIAQAAPEVDQVDVKRLEGKTRIETAIEASQEAYDDGQASVAVLAGFAGEVDALTGTLLASHKKAPLLLTEKNKLDQKVKDELERLGTEAIYVLGGDAVVSDELIENLKKDYAVERVSGSDRTATADAVAKKSMKTSDHAFLALGFRDQLSDALAIGPVSASQKDPVLLTQTHKLPKETIKTLDYLKVKNVTVVGGEEAVSEKVVDQLKDKNINVRRLKGSTREETAIAIAEEYFEKPENTILAYGYKYADALVGGYLGNLKNAPILLSDKKDLHPATKEYLESKPFNVFVLGGKAAISEKAYKKVEGAALMTENEKEAAKLVEEFETKLKGKEKVLALVEDDQLRQEVSSSHTDVFNEIQKVENKTVRQNLLDRLDKAHDRLIGATSVKALLDVSKDGVTEENLDRAKIKLSNAKTNVKKLEDQESKDALNALIEDEEAKIDAAQAQKDEKEALAAVNENLTVKTLEENASALGLDLTKWNELKDHEKYGQARVAAVTYDMEANKSDEGYTVEDFRKYFNAALKNRTVYAQSMDYVNGIGDKDLTTDKFISNVVAVLEETKTDLPLQHENTKVEEEIITPMTQLMDSYNSLSQGQRGNVLDAVKAGADYEGYSGLLGKFASEVQALIQ